MGGPDLEEIFADLTDLDGRIAEGLLPPEAETFANSVREKLEGFAAWEEEGRSLTPRQQEACENIHRGIRSWLRHGTT